MRDVILVVDQYQRYMENRRSNLPSHPDFDAQMLSLLIRPLGYEYRCIALISREDLKGFCAFQKAGFEIVTLNGDRPQRIRELVVELIHELDSNPPRHLILVTTDPMFQILCDRATRQADVTVSVWTPEKEIPSELCHPAYHARPLENLLPSPKINQVDVRLDYENIYGAIRNRGWSLDTKTIIESVRASIADLGVLTSVTAYGDWSALAKYAGRDIQRELALLGVKTRYQISLKGKNSADMEIAEDIHRLLKLDDSEDTANIIVLGTCDRDFRPVLETSRKRGKGIVILGMEGNVSRELMYAAHEIRYLDQKLHNIHLRRWITSRIRHCLITKGMPYVDTCYLINGMLQDETLRQLGIAANRDVAGQWLKQVKDSKKIITKQQPHPRDPSKEITTWWLCETPKIKNLFEFVDFDQKGTRNWRPQLQFA